MIWTFLNSLNCHREDIQSSKTSLTLSRLIMTNSKATGSYARRFLTGVVLLLAMVWPATLHGLNFVSAGVNFAPDMEVEVTGSPSPASGTFDIKTGYRFSAGYDFRLSRFMSLELESGFLYNDID